MSKCLLIMQIKCLLIFLQSFLFPMTQSLLLSDPKQLMDTIVFCLNSIVEQTETIQGQISIFDIKNKPTISFPNYLIRIFNYMGCSLTAYVYSLILIDKIQQENTNFKFNSKNIHRLLFTSIVVATKFIDDKYYKNKYYATVGGISLQQLNQQQQKMLELLNYHCPVNSDIFDSYLQKLEKFNLNLQEQQKQKITQCQQPQTPLTQASSPKQKKRVVREKRERSREKISDRHYDTQESREIDLY